MVENDIAVLIPEGQQLQPKSDRRFIVYGESTQNPKGYITIETSEGYGGDMIVAVMVDTLGTIKDLEILKHRETPSFFDKVVRKGLIEDLVGKSCTQSIESGNEVDVITGATKTSKAIMEGALLGSRHIASGELGLEIPVDASEKFRIGIPAITLLILYAVALSGIYTRFRYKKGLRWITMLTALAILGFWFSVPLSLPRINLFLMGFWPRWHDNLYWYILVIGFFLIIVITRKNIYCSWICPLGCIQDGLGILGGARARFSGNVNHILKWVQRGVAWLAIVLALYFRNPVQLNYEIFGVSLSLTGTTYLFVLTGIFLMASVFIKRPWCNYLCPITPVADMVRILSSRKIKLSNSKIRKQEI